MVDFAIPAGVKQDRRRKREGPSDPPHVRHPHDCRAQVGLPPDYRTVITWLTNGDVVMNGKVIADNVRELGSFNTLLEKMGIPPMRIKPVEEP